MSRHSSNESTRGSEILEGLEIIREEQNNLNDSPHTGEDSKTKINAKEEKYIIFPCDDILEKERLRKFEEETQKLLQMKEDEVKGFQKKHEDEIQYLKDKFDFILRNEQIRSSCMLREAHRERQEKITALQTQMECKNLAALMYVMCSERRKSKVKVLKLKEEYSRYIEALLYILNESQSLILNLSRGYKTAARVDDEWRKKMKNIINEYQQFIYHYAGGSSDMNQYFLDIPKLLKIETSTEDDPNENPCEAADENISEEASSTPEAKKRHWWDDLDKECHPFVVFGDMAEFEPPQRREVLKVVKAAKTAPKKWKEYSFNDAFLKERCENDDILKDKYFRHSTAQAWECPSRQDRQSSKDDSDSSRRVTTASADVRGAMGSILRIISSAATSQPPKSTLLAARDSMEIASATRLREKHRHSHNSNKVILNIGNKVDSIFQEMDNIDQSEEEALEFEIKQGAVQPDTLIEDDEDKTDASRSRLGSMHVDSLQVISSHVPDPDHKINNEKVCPMGECQRMTVDEFTRSLPPYMRASPFTHFEKTYEEYEACTPEQLEILKQRLEEKKKIERVDFGQIQDNPLSEWTPSAEGVAMQTSSTNVYIPSCTCATPRPTPASSDQRIYKLPDLVHMKQELDQINAENFFNDNIEFNRFQVVGQDEDERASKNQWSEGGRDRLDEIKKVLNQHPSLCEIFEGSVPC